MKRLIERIRHWIAYGTDRRGCNVCDTVERMRRQGIAIAVLVLALFVGTAKAQDCPTGNVCLPQATANKLLDSVNQLIEAKTLISKLLTERNASDAVIASANRVIADFKQLDEINGMMILKYKTVVDLYEKTLTLYSTLVDKMTTQLNKPKSAWAKFLSGVKSILTLAAGVALGRGF